VYLLGGKEAQLVDEFKFDDVHISSLSSSNESSNALSFDFGSYTQGHVQINPDGSSSTGAGKGWDFVENKAITGSTPIPDAVDAPILPSVEAGTALEYYIKFDGVGGSEWLELGSFSLGFSNPGGAHTGAGGGAGKVVASGLYSQLGSSSTAVALSHALVTGEDIKDVQIEVYLAGGKEAQLIDEYKFSGVQLDSLSTSGSDGYLGNGVSFQFVEYGHSHVAIDDKSGKASTEETGWNFKDGKSAEAPAVHPEVDFKDIEPQVGSGNLAVYAHFDGIDGWLKVDAFSMGLSSSVDVLGAGGAGAGKVSASDVSLSLGMSSGLVQLNDDLFKGTILKDAEIEVYLLGGKEAQLVDEFKFDDVHISSLSSSNESSNALSFDFGSYSHGHVALDGKGGVAGTTVEGWDLAQNHTASDLSPPHPDVDLFA
jgi:type VI protein secretion system component Hcp